MLRTQRHATPGVGVTLAPLTVGASALVCLIVTFGLTGILTIVTPTPASAASCTNGGVRQSGTDASLPWAQQRYGLDRLSGIADGTGQIIAVVDSGVDATHPQLRGAVVAGIDSLDAQSDGQLDCVGHGTAVASIIAARQVGGTRFRGIAPGAKIMPVRVSERQDIDGGSTGRAVTMHGLAQAIIEAVERGATVVNLSLVTTQDDSTLRAAVLYALDHNVVVVAAVGNQHAKGNPTPYPAAYPGVVGVGAIGPDSARLPDSQTGAYVDVVAPGDQVVAATPGGGHAAYRGTSFAVPFVAATAALIRQYHPELPATAVIARLSATADPTPGGPNSAEYGAGAINPYRAVTGQVAGPGERLAGTELMPSQTDAAAARAARTRTRTALTVAGACSASAIVFMLAAVAVPRGMRRRWRPGLP